MVLFISSMANWLQLTNSHGQHGGLPTLGHVDHIMWSEVSTRDKQEKVEDTSQGVSEATEEE